MIGIRDRNNPNGYKTNSTTQKVDATLSSTSNNPPSNKAVRNAMPFNFGIDEDGNYGYIPIGADSVVPFKQFKNGEFVQGVGQINTYIEVGFKPKIIYVRRLFETVAIYNETIDSTKFIVIGNNKGTYNLGASVGYEASITSIDDNGFTITTSFPSTYGKDIIWSAFG